MTARRSSSASVAISTAQTLSILLCVSPPRRNFWPNACIYSLWPIILTRRRSTQLAAGVSRVALRPAGHAAGAVFVALLPFDAGLLCPVKSPAEYVVGLMRLVGDYALPKPGFHEIALECRYMGQDLMNPPSVEGWHMGKEWIDTGILVERVNFGAKQLGDISKPGVQRLLERLRARPGVQSGGTGGALP